jgi:hypothetical protein
MEKIVIPMEMFLELHRKAVMYDLLNKEYNKSTYHSNADEVVFGCCAEKKIKTDMLGDEE